MKSKNKKIIRYLAFAFSLFIMIFIFFMSAQNASESSKLSGGFIRLIAPIFKPGFNMLSEIEQSEFVSSLQKLVRKLAHFSIYTALGASLATGIFTLNIKKIALRPIFSFIIGAFYAVSDEFHQSFIPGRSGELRDVLIDSSGVLLGVVFITLIYIVFKRKKTCS